MVINKTILLYIAGALVLGITLYLIYKRIGLIKSAEQVREENAKKAIETNPDLWSLDYWKNRGNTLSTDTAKKLAEMIKESFGFFNDDESQIYEAFRLMKARVNVSQVSDIYYQMFNKHLYNDLTEYLSQSELNYIYGIILTKP